MMMPSDSMSSRMVTKTKMKAALLICEGAGASGCEAGRGSALDGASLRIGILLFSQHQPDRRSRQIQCFTQCIDQIAPIGIRNSFRTTGKQNECRRPALGLGDIVEADAPARHGGVRTWA